ncbi:MAG: Chromosome partition protein Smc, partial [Pseudomonadota bacterium]
IIDAVRWVMGESSARQLRGENITDVIFSGSNTRKPTAQASIELIFDNADARIGGEFAAYGEIAVRRTVTRDAQSNYYLNGNRCRRRDVMDLFLGTGFGPRSYSIIEQGMISQLVEARPEDLRVYLEEAAGISKYKERRRETENRIRHTRENLERLTDLRDELARQLDRLRRQADAAERYRTLKSEERRTIAELNTLRYLDLSARLEARQRDIAELEVALERAAAEQQHIETAVERERQRHGETADRFNSVQGRFYQVGADISRVEEAIQFGQKRVRQLELDLGTLEERATENARQLAADEAEIVALETQIARLAPDVEALAAADQSSAERLVELESGYRDWQRRWDQVSAESARHEREAEVQAQRVVYLGQQLERLRSRQAQFENDLEALPVGDSDEVTMLAEGIAEAEAARDVVEGRVAHALDELGLARASVETLDQAQEETRRTVLALRNEFAGLDAVQQVALGRGALDSADWIAGQGLTTAPRLGEDLAVAAGWEQAVETVLGDHLQAIVVPQLDTFESALTDLGAAGWAGGALNLAEARFDPATEGELPALAAFVRSRRLRLGSLLHGVFAAESVSVALAHRAALNPGQSIITRAGVWVGPDWVRVLGRGEDESGIIERGQAIETLGLRVEEAERALEAQQSALQSARARVRECEAARDEAQRELARLAAEIAERRADHSVRRMQLAELDARRARLERDREDLVRQIADEQARLEAERPRLAAAESARDAARSERTGVADARVDLERGLEEARQAARSARDRFHAANGEQRSLESRLTAVQSARERLVQQSSRLGGERERVSAGIEESARPLPALTEERDALLATRLAVEGELVTVRSALESIDHDIRTFEQNRTQVQSTLSGLRTALETARVERQGQWVEARNLSQLVVQAGFELETVRTELPPDARESDWVARLTTLDNRITRLGPINLAAIEEFETQSERKVYLDQQNADLEEALETLLNAIRKIDRETRQRFKETFDRVNTRLGELFPRVFGGGHAALELTGEDLLDTGVTLMAQPPGKRNASINLLSGGEKAMTAVAFIFAIFHLNPSPVCLLDEVDAPLDDANVQRFADLIREMSESVQFVVITHNKITMEMADHLLGVTMNEPGVSRLVTVDVEEAAALAVQ